MLNRLFDYVALQKFKSGFLVGGRIFSQKVDILLITFETWLQFHFRDKIWNQGEKLDQYENWFFVSGYFLTWPLHTFLTFQLNMLQTSFHYKSSKVGTFEAIFHQYLKFTSMPRRLSTAISIPSDAIKNTSLFQHFIDLLLFFFSWQRFFPWCVKDNASLLCEFCSCSMFINSYKLHFDPNWHMDALSCNVCNHATHEPHFFCNELEKKKLLANSKMALRFLVFRVEQF